MNSAEAKRPYTFWWIFQRFSGALLVILLMAHIIISHFALGDFEAKSLTPESILNHYNSAFFQFFYAVFLILAIPHGINGVLNAVDDYIRNDFWRMTFTWVAWAVGIAIFAFGMLTLTIPTGTV